MFKNVSFYELNYCLDRFSKILVFVNDINNVISDIVISNLKRITYYNPNLIFCIVDIDTFNKTVEKNKLKINKVLYGNLYLLEKNSIKKLPYLCNYKKLTEYIG